MRFIVFSEMKEQIETLEKDLSIQKDTHLELMEQNTELNESYKRKAANIEGNN